MFMKSLGDIWFACLCWNSKIVVLLGCIKKESSEHFHSFNAFMYLASVICALAISPNLCHSEISCNLIPFHDIAPEGACLNECWNGLGIDSSGMIYIGISDLTNTPQDVY